MPKSAKTKNPVLLRKSSATTIGGGRNGASVTKRPRAPRTAAAAVAAAAAAQRSAVRRQRGRFPHEDDSVVFVQLTRDRADVRSAQRQVRRYIQPLAAQRQRRRPRRPKSVRFAPSLRQYFDADDAATAVVHSSDSSGSVVIVDDTLPGGEPAPQQLSVQMTEDETEATSGEVHILFTNVVSVDAVSTASLDAAEPMADSPAEEEEVPEPEVDSAMNVDDGVGGGGGGAVDMVESLPRLPAADLGDDFGMDNGSGVVAALSPALSAVWLDDPFEEFLRDIRASR